MATLSKITKYRRKLRRDNMGKDRKARARIDGTTPKFPVHTADADANAPAAELSPSASE